MPIEKHKYELNEEKLHKYHLEVTLLHLKNLKKVLSNFRNDFNHKESAFNTYMQRRLGHLYYLIRDLQIHIENPNQPPEGFDEIFEIEDEKENTDT